MWSQDPIRPSLQEKLGQCFVSLFIDKLRAAAHGGTTVDGTCLKEAGGQEIS